MKELPEYLTKAEVAVRHRCSIRTVERRIEAGVLAACQAGGPGGRVLIARDALLLFEHRLRCGQKTGASGRGAAAKPER